MGLYIYDLISLGIDNDYILLIGGGSHGTSH